MPQAGLPLLAAVWFSVVAPVVVVDGVFVLTRSLDVNIPHPLSEVVPFKYWLIYAQYDRRYAPNNDAFVVAQSWLNLVEVALGLVAVMLGLLRANNAAVKLAILVATMTLFKTVLYYVLDIVEEGLYTKHNTFAEQFAMVIVPSSFWIIVPAVIIKQCFRILTLVHVPEKKGKAKAAQQQQQQQPNHAQNSNGNNNNNNKSNKKKK